jgi:RND family efflux transporter MFP subunit
MRFYRQALLGLLFLALTLGLLGLAAVVVGNALRAGLGAGGPGLPADERVVAASVTMLTPGSITPEMTVFGTVEARRTLTLRSQRGGRVVWVSDQFRNGVKVGPDTLLLKLDPAPAADALALAKVNLTEAMAATGEAATALALASEDLAAAQAQAALRDQALARQRDLAARGAGSPVAVETAELAASSAGQAVLSRRQALAAAKARVDQAAVAVTRAEIALAEATRALEETELRAGLSGRVTGATVTAGALLTPNEVLGQIIDPDRLDVAVRLSTAEFAQLLQPDGSFGTGAVSVLPGGAGTALPARLDRIAAAVDPGQTGRLVYASLDESPAGATQLQPGDFVTVVIAEAPLPDTARLPATALGRNGTLLVLGPDDRLEELPVQVLRRQGDDVIVAVGALAGRDVVTERSVLLGAGIRIRPIRPDAVDG